jgi:hypothetical protein
MKKILFLIAVVLGTRATFAQNKFNAGISIGGGITGIKNDLMYKNGGSLRLALIAEYSFTRNISVLLNPSFSYFTTKYSDKFSVPGGKGYDLVNINRFNTIATPLCFKMKASGGKAKPYYSIGLGPSFLVSHKNIETIGGSLSKNTYYSASNTGYKNLYWTVNNYFGIELQGDKITPYIEFVTIHSFTPTSESYHFDGLNSYTLSLGFKF